MDGLMMDYPLTTQAILRRAEAVFGQREIVTRLSDNTLHRYTVETFCGRVRQLMSAMATLGIQPGDRVGTYCWNHYRHLELYFAISSMGAVLHTLNIRLSDEQLQFIINHAEDKLVFVDSSLLGQLETVQESCPTVERFVVIDEQDQMPETPLRGALEYEALLQSGDPSFSPPEPHEQAAAAMCYTSGTTGDPKGVVYSQRSIYLHTLGVMIGDGIGLRQRDTVLPFVPMFHANAWGVAHAALMAGSKLVLPGPGPGPADLAMLMEKEQVTLAAGVPTIWNMLYQYLKQNPQADVSSVETLVVGGSAAPRAMIQNYAREFGITILHLWGMTEMSPLGTVSRPKAHMLNWDEERLLDVRMKQGMPAPGVEIRVQDDKDQPLPRDGQTIGELAVRGPWVARAYYNNPAASKAFTADGWFKTGDVVTIDPEGYMQIADRTKDLIKSGGEWISSVDMENAIMARDDVLEACVVARPDDKWDERPVAFVVRAAGGSDSPTPQDIFDHLAGQFAKWQVPYLEDIHFIEAVPKTSVGKFDKKVLRGQLS